MADYIRQPCPKCGHPLRIREEYVGRQVICKRCKHEFLVDPSLAEREGAPAPPLQLAPDPALKEALERLERGASALREERDALKGQGSALREEQDGLREQVSALLSKLDEARAAVGRSADQAAGLAPLRKEHDRLAAELDALRQERDKERAAREAEAERARQEWQ